MLIFICKVRTQWINGINTIITSTGKKVQVAYKHEHREVVCVILVERHGTNVETQADHAKGKLTLKRWPTLRPAKEKVHSIAKEISTTQVSFVCCTS